MKREKQYLLDELKEQLGQSGSYLIAQYSSLSANKANEFRRVLTKCGAHLEVIKKRVFIKAAKDIGATFTEEALKGHIGIIMTQVDPVELTKAVIKYSEENEKSIVLLGGCIEGQTIDAQDMNKVATLPSKPEMRAQLLGLFQAPMSDMLSVVQSVLTSVVYCLDNRSSKTE